MSIAWAAVVFMAIALVSLGMWRLADRKTDESVWSDLASKARASVDSYDVAMTEGLPEPAQRYFNFMIAPGTPLCNGVEICMTGELGRGDLDNPKYAPMSARQVLVPPFGLVWEVKVGMLSGSDAVTATSSWTRFWLAELIPVVRVGANADHRRSAFGRVIAEAAFWVPASLLPSKYVKWRTLSGDTARAIVTFGELEQAVDITVARDGQPTCVVIRRWSNENKERIFREQPFGGSLSEFLDFDGYRLPTKIEGGNHFGTEQYFPFYKAKVERICLL